MANSKRIKLARDKVTVDLHSLSGGLNALKTVAEDKEAAVKFPQAIDIVLKLAVPKGDSVRGSICPDHGTGKTVKVAVFAKGEQAKNAADAGADRVGAEDLIEEFKKGDIPFDLIIAEPSMMAEVGKLGRVLGPKGLMPNPKLGTVSADVAQAVKNAKKGQIFFRSEKEGLVHARIGPANFTTEQLVDNIKLLVAELKRLKPSRSKGQYIRKCYLSTTMGPSVAVDLNTLD